MSELKGELTEIRGIGDAKAEAVLEILDGHGETAPSETVAKNVRDGWDYYQDGQEHQALSYLERAYDALEG